MRKGLASFVGFLLFAAAVSAAPCAPSATSLCLSTGRFEVSVAWKDFQNRTGAGQAVPLTADTGYFWFFSDSNIELIVKVLDARALNGKFWVFFGALSNVEYTLTVRDSVTGSTRTYVNPSGQFASVGDTTAFEGNAGVSLASQRAVVTSGSAASPSSIAAIQRFIDRAAPKSAFTPCPDTYLGFDLAGCRFHIEVSWKDNQGNTGVGIPVQLTNDTGYFWFFSEANVELMVKVLDARPINGNFWVFFGALSDVQYTVLVTDTVTGASRSYTNASGTFASVGDTAAFRGGYSVVSVPDPAHAASADLDPTGGAVSTTGADGTVFTLEIPPGAMMASETVTLTPVSRIDRFPYSGGLVAGVEIEPQGLDLLVPAVLTIHPPSPPSPDRTLPYSHAAGGEDLILYPRDVDTSSVRLPVARLAGYGIGLGGETDAATQAGRMPTGTLSPYLQQYAHDVFLRVIGQIGQAELQARAKQISLDALQQFFPPRLSPPAGGVLRPALPPGPEECVSYDSHGNPQSVRENIQTLFGLIQQQEMLGIVEDSDIADTMAGVIQELTRCIQEAFDHCVARSDPLEATLMLQLSLQLQVLGVDDPLLTTFEIGGLLERCLRFEIDFESKVTEEASRDPVRSTERLKYRAQHVPLRLDYAGVENIYGFRSVWQGICSLLPEDAAFYYTSGGAGCTVEVHPGKSTFDVLVAWIGLPTFYHGVRVLYIPGDPDEPATESCPGFEPDPDFAVESFIAPYTLLHQNDQIDGVFKAQHWTQLRFQHGFSQNDQYLAKRSYEQSKQVDPYLKVSEETFFFLKHTPDAPMPECPP